MLSSGSRSFERHIEFGRSPWGAVSDRSLIPVLVGVESTIIPEDLASIPDWTDDASEGPLVEEVVCIVLPYDPIGEELTPAELVDAEYCGFDTRDIANRGYDDDMSDLHVEMERAALDKLTGGSYWNRLARF